MGATAIPSRHAESAHALVVVRKSSGRRSKPNCNCSVKMQAVGPKMSQSEPLLLQAWGWEDRPNNNTIRSSAASSGCVAFAQRPREIYNPHSWGRVTKTVYRRVGGHRRCTGRRAEKYRWCVER